MQRRLRSAVAGKTSAESASSAAPATKRPAGRGTVPDSTPSGWSLLPEISCRDCGAGRGFSFPAHSQPRATFSPCPQQQQALCRRQRHALGATWRWQSGRPGAHNPGAGHAVAAAASTSRNVLRVRATIIHAPRREPLPSLYGRPKAGSSFFKSRGS